MPPNSCLSLIRLFSGAQHYQQGAEDGQVRADVRGRSPRSLRARERQVPLLGLLTGSQHGRQWQATLQERPLGDQAGMVTTKFQSESPTFKNDLNQVSSKSFLMTSSTALANKGLFELTRRPSLKRAVSLSFAETTEEPDLLSREKAKIVSKFRQITAFSPVVC